MQSSTTIQCRRASPADAALLAQLRYEFRASHAPTIETEEEFLSRCAAWMVRRLGADAAWRAWLAECPACLAGGVWFQVVEKLPNPNEETELHAYVSNFYVRPEHRNAGAGSALLSTILDECGRLGIDTVFLWPTERSRPLYERFGFQSERGVLVRKLDP